MMTNQSDVNEEASRTKIYRVNCNDKTKEGKKSGQHLDQTYSHFQHKQFRFPQVTIELLLQVSCAAMYYLWNSGQVEGKEL